MKLIDRKKSPTQTQSGLGTKRIVTYLLWTMPSLWKKLYIICIFVILFKQGMHYQYYSYSRLDHGEGHARASGDISLYMPFVYPCLDKMDNLMWWQHAFAKIQTFKPYNYKCYFENRRPLARVSGPTQNRKPGS